MVDLQDFAERVQRLVLIAGPKLDEAVCLNRCRAIRKVSYNSTGQTRRKGVLLKRCQLIREKLGDLREIFRIHRFGLPLSLRRWAASRGRHGLAEQPLSFNGALQGIDIPFNFLAIVLTLA